MRWMTGENSGDPRATRGRSVRSALLIMFGIVASACVAQGVVVVGETPVPPPADVPVVSVSVLDDVGAPVSGATVVSEDDQRTTSGTDGMATIEWRGRPVTVSIDAEGFFPGAVAVEAFDEEAFELALRPVVLRGTVTDSSGFGLSGAAVSLGAQTTMTDTNGAFELSRATQGTITTERPGWELSETEWDGQALVTEIALAPRVIRGLHIGPNVLGDEAEWANLLEVAEETIVNSLVIDVKDETGRVFYDSGVPLAREVGAVRPLFDLADVVSAMDERELYKIARIVTFQDPVAARAEPDLAVYDTTTGSAYEKRGQYFLDPSDPVARAYALDLAVDVCAAGFDEIQFDYVRYPDGFPDTARFDRTPTEEVRTETIVSFLEEARTRLHPMNCAVAADVFGFTTSINNDGGIGQQFNTLSNSTDVLSPMIYPSHYSSGWFGYDNPNDHPGGVVSEALDDGMVRVDGPAIVRPWLQDFYYTSSQVRAQIEEAESRSLGWMLWNALSNFQWEALTESALVGSGGAG